MLSDAYQRSSASHAANEKIDPENRYLWRQNRRRLEAEALLDCMLAVSGELDRTVGGESKPLAADFRRRTLYAKTGRFQQDETLVDVRSAGGRGDLRAAGGNERSPAEALLSEFGHRRRSGRRRWRRASRRQGADEGSPPPIGFCFNETATESERQAGPRLSAGGGANLEAVCQGLLSSNEFAYVD